MDNNNDEIKVVKTPSREYKMLDGDIKRVESKVEEMKLKVRYNTNFKNNLIVLGSAYLTLKMFEGMCTLTKFLTGEDDLKK